MKPFLVRGPELSAGVLGEAWDDIPLPEGPCRTAPLSASWVFPTMLEERRAAMTVRHAAGLPSFAGDRMDGNALPPSLGSVSAHPMDARLQASR